MGTTQRQPVLVEFGRRVRAARQTSGRSQELLAEHCGFHRTYIGTIERGERNPALTNIVRLADALGCAAGDLVSGLHA